MKLYGNLILAATICVVIFWIIMALRPAHAASRVVVGKPTVIQGALLPPPKYDKLYDGELEIRFFSNTADVQLYHETLRQSYSGMPRILLK